MNAWRTLGFALHGLLNTTAMLIVIAQDMDAFRTEVDSGQSSVASTLTALRHFSKKAHFQPLVQGLRSVRASP